jgi:hypothetical protein
MGKKGIFETLIIDVSSLASVQNAVSNINEPMATPLVSLLAQKLLQEIYWTSDQVEHQYKREMYL